jgi:hypothetical protein
MESRERLEERVSRALVQYRALEKSNLEGQKTQIPVAFDMPR